MPKYVVVPGVVEVYSNVDYIPRFALGPNLFPLTSFRPCPIKIHFFVCQTFCPPPGLQNSVYPFYVGDSVVYYEHPLFGPFKLQTMISDLQRIPKLHVNKTCFRLIQRPIGNLLPPGILCTDIIWAKLITNNMTIVHGSCISLNDDGILILGLSGAGKSLTAYLSQKNNFQYLSEDITIVDEKRAYACPFTQSFLNEDLFIKTLLKDKKIGTRDYFRIISLKRVEKLLKPSLFLPFNVLTPSKIKMTESFRENVDIKNIFILERGTIGISELSMEEALKRILLLNRTEFYYDRDIFLTLYSLHNPEFKYESLLLRGKAILTKLVEKSNCFLIQTPHPSESLNLIQRCLKK